MKPKTKKKSLIAFIHNVEGFNFKDNEIDFWLTRPDYVDKKWFHKNYKKVKITIEDL